MTLTQQLKDLGYNVKKWPFSDSEFYCYQITDPNGITAYLPQDSTFEQCLQRMKQKRAEFDNADK